ncbi:MAG: hypothetical protein NZ602_16530 [Thermoguttaceae bacterium]|nr:hypothetical protein [Thermoguttaceae bacterium]MDW8038689.1 hypothetical protein [Thermoguttaceae bacterium]
MMGRRFPCRNLLRGFAGNGLGLGPPMRPAVTLMEVLIAIFILAVGLFGVAALLPVGGSEALEATKIQRAATLGSAALREIQVRNLLQPFQWNTTTKQLEPLWYWQDVAVQDLSGYRFMLIDPLGVGAARDAGRLAEWAYFPKGTTLMPRLSIRRNLLATAPLSSTEAWDLFGTQERDEAYYRNPDYSWMLMIGPMLPNQTSPTWANCSVVVFYKRDLDVSKSSPEVVVALDGTPTLNEEGGGELVLNATADTLRNRLKPNHWLLLYSSQWCQWYRIVAAAKPSASGKWYVTVVGSQWMGASQPPTHVLLMEGLIGVYSQIMEVDFSRTRRLELFGRK